MKATHLVKYQKLGISIPNLGLPCGYIDRPQNTKESAKDLKDSTHQFSPKPTMSRQPLNPVWNTHPFHETKDVLILTMEPTPGIKRIQPFLSHNPSQPNPNVLFRA